MKNAKEKYAKDWVTGILGLALMFFSLSTAQAQSESALSVRVGNLERTSEKNNQDLARTVNLLTQIQQEFQSIRGQVDASRYLDQEKDRVYRDLDLRVSGLEDKIDQIHRLLKEMTANPKGAGAMKLPAAAKEYEDYQALLLLMNGRDYHAAASGFLGYLKKYPRSPYVPQAMYWTAESFYSMGDFARAIKEFQQLVQTYPEDPRAKEAIYKQGLAFDRLKKYSEAKLFYQKVMASYPNTAEASKAQARLHWIEETEKNQVALGETSQPSGTSSQTPKQEGVPPGEGSANRPIYKISPYPKPPSATPPPSAPEPAGEGSGDAGSRPAEPTGGKDSAPLF